MTSKMIAAVGGLLASAAVAAPVPENVPELMRCEDGTAVSTVAQWEGKRRAEILEFFTREVYGRRPVDRPADGVVYQEGSVSYHIRTGKHNLEPYDWHRYMDFADRHGWRNGCRPQN